jgi:hypothetical protein
LTNAYRHRTLLQSLCSRDVEFTRNASLQLYFYDAMHFKCWSIMRVKHNAASAHYGNLRFMQGMVSLAR